MKIPPFDSLVWGLLRLAPITFILLPHDWITSLPYMFTVVISRGQLWSHTQTTETKVAESKKRLKKKLLSVSR